MKLNNGILALLAVTIGFLATACSNNTVTGHSVDLADADYHDSLEKENLRHLVLKVDGMYCASCGPGLAKMFSESDGVVLAKVNRQEKKAEIIYDATKTSKEKIIGMLNQPYSGKVMADMLANSGMVESVKALKNA